ncbi:MAG: hypothetical protein O2783_05625 [Chloroflexi bacterium]|nr:hypothetical protein [Chloroflexota bacterium]
MAQEQPIAHTPHTEITLDQLGEIQPGLARLMAEVSDRYWILYYAAKGGNWKLAALQSSELEKALRIGAVTRPRYTAHLEAFIKGPLTAMNRAIEGLDWDAFESVYNAGIITANAYHREWNHEEIVWQLPDEPPKHLRLTAGQ